MKYSSRNSFKISTIQKDMKFERAENNMNVLSVFKSAMTFLKSSPWLCWTLLSFIHSLPSNIFIMRNNLLEVLSKHLILVLNALFPRPIVENITHKPPKQTADTQSPTMSVWLLSPTILLAPALHLLTYFWSGTCTLLNEVITFTP